MIEPNLLFSSLAESQPARDPSREPAIVATGPDDFSAELREIGDYAVWSVSSAKQGHGVEQLRTSHGFWQSDGPQPHSITLQFQQKLVISQLALSCSFKADESYTPQNFSIRAGTTSSDLKEIMTFTLEEPEGWRIIPLYLTINNEGNFSTRPLKARVLEIAVLSNHQNGRDTHIRQVKVYGPRPDPLPGRAIPLQSLSMLVYSNLR